MKSSADLSTCGKYRYHLTREWGFGGRTMLFVMLNPSTADAMQDDPTIRRCMRFAKDAGFDGIGVVNLFAYRATDPDELKRGGDIIGRANDVTIVNAARKASCVVLAWGAHGDAYKQRVRDVVVKLTVACSSSLNHLGLTASGQPKHPLYLPSTARPAPINRGPIFDIIMEVL